MSLNLDKLDLHLLEELQNNARISIKEISDRIHLSANAVAARIRRLENDGYIRQYTTILNHSMVNRNVEGITGVNLTQNNYQNVASFWKHVNSIPEIYHCYRINSVFDFILHVVAIDMHDYHKVLMDDICKLNCVSKVTPFIVLSDDGSNVIDLSHLLK